MPVRNSKRKAKNGKTGGKVESAIGAEFTVKIQGEKTTNEGCLGGWGLEQEDDEGERERDALEAVEVYSKNIYK